jgi:hypothetical protein
VVDSRWKWIAALRERCDEESLCRLEKANRALVMIKDERREEQVILLSHRFEE